jgi:1H-pyrrole-2-carbonyl-[peptidyl-carrier protein] chlorinase
MTGVPKNDFDVVIIGGGPAGSVLASLLAQAGYRALVLERDIHPRDHVGESLTPSTNPIFKRIGFLEKMEDTGFVHKPGACWTAPRAPVGKFLAIRLGEFPPPGATQFYTYNVERDVFDAMLLRHASELGAKVVQGARAQEVLFDDDGRAVGVRARVTDGWERDIFARFVVDASGRRCVLASNSGTRRRIRCSVRSGSTRGSRTWSRILQGMKGCCSCTSWTSSGRGRGRSRCETACPPSAS